MSIEQPEIVDYIAINPEKKAIILAISDHLDWTDLLRHLHMLQEKMNTYAMFVEGGQVWEVASEQAGKEIAPFSYGVEIKVYLSCTPPKEYSKFIKTAREAFAEINLKISDELIEE